MLRRDRTGEDIGPGLPDHLKFLLDVPPVPAGAHERCTGSGRCQTMHLSGVTCGALFTTCALHPMQASAQGVRVEDEKREDFAAVVAGLKARHPELFSWSPAAVEAKPVTKPKAIPRPAPEIVPDRMSAAAGAGDEDDWAEEVTVHGSLTERPVEDE